MLEVWFTAAFRKYISSVPLLGISPVRGVVDTTAMQLKKGNHSYSKALDKRLRVQGTADEYGRGSMIGGEPKQLLDLSNLSCDT